MKRRAREQGFTLIEIMIALIVSSLLVAMIIGIFTQMSAAYRTQQQVAELQQVLQAAQVTVEADVRQAGYRCAQGFTWAGSTAVPVSALTITDGGTGPQQPDQIAVFYGDPSAQAQVISALPAGNSQLTSVVVDAVDPTWAIGDKVLFTVETRDLGSFAYTVPSGMPEDPPAGDLSGRATVPYYYACVLQIANINGTTITFSTAAPWGTAGNPQCQRARTAWSAPSDAPPMLYKFVARAYRIDPTRKDLSVFQVSPSGGLVANDWTDLGIGFTNFQIASRWFSGATGFSDNSDTDADPKRNWYSDTVQNTLSTADVTWSHSLEGATGSLKVPLQVSVSFVVRTTRHVVDGTVTGATPALQVAGNVGANDVGDSPSVTLAGVADSSRPQELRGDNIYRYATVKIDTRNLGVNR